MARLKNAIGRVEASWRPASPDEGFEIVRRRLFQPLTGDQFVARDAVARAFVELYGSQQQEFPSECREADYERRIKMAYPIHPELFDRLYNDWSTLDKFQRTRGVLRLMAAVIHSLWERQDSNVLIMPGNVPVDDQIVQFELTRYLEDQWVPVIEKDVDGANSLPLTLDRENPNLGRYSACRRVSRTIYMGSAPTLRASHRGIDDRQVKLGCVQPGEAVATFGDALRRLTDSATYLYVDGKRYWYSTQPTVTRLADDRAGQLTDDQVIDEIIKRLREAGPDTGRLLEGACLRSKQRRARRTGGPAGHSRAGVPARQPRRQKPGPPGSGRDPRLTRKLAPQLQEYAGLPRRRRQPAARVGAGRPAVPRLVIDLGRPGNAEPGPVPDPPGRDQDARAPTRRSTFASPKPTSGCSCRASPIRRAKSSGLT